MIAFAKRSILAKITTACTGRNVQAVLPISSCRNVMAKHKDSKELNACKSCGKTIKGSYKRNPKAKLYCDANCRRAKIDENKIAVHCCVCGKEVIRRKADLKTRSKFACSLDCQRNYSMVVNHSSRANKDWVKASLKAKAKWKVRRSKERRLVSSDYKFWQKSKAWVYNQKNAKANSVWLPRCQSARSCLIQRSFEPVIGSRKSKKHSLVDKVNLFLSISAMDSRKGWERKCESVKKNLRRRWQRKMAMKERRLLRENTEKGVLRQLRLKL